MQIPSLGWTDEEILDAEEQVDRIAEQIFTDGGAMVFDRRKRGAEAIYIDPEGTFGTTKVIDTDGTETVKRFGEH